MRHERRFLLLEEMTAEVRAAEKAVYARLIRAVAYKVGNSVAASSSLLTVRFRTKTYGGVRKALKTLP